MGSVVFLFSWHYQRLIGYGAFSEQVAKHVERTAIRQTQSLRIGRPAVEGEAVEIGVVVRMIIEMRLQPSDARQFLIHVKLTYNARSAVGGIGTHHTQIGLDGQAVFKQLGAQRHLVFVVSVLITGMIAET